MSLIAAGLGIVYVLLGVRALAAGAAPGMPLLALGTAAIVVGALTWWRVGRGT